MKGVTSSSAFGCSVTTRIIGTRYCAFIMLAARVSTCARCSGVTELMSVSPSSAAIASSTLSGVTCSTLFV